MSRSIRGLRVILYGLIFLLFFQLIADFVETIYAFGLLGTSIPPEIVCVLFFFSPLILLLFRNGLPRRIGTILVIVAVVMRAIEVSAGPSVKMIASGLGTGCLLVLFPVWLSRPDEIEGASSLEMGYGLAAGLVASILFRMLGAGSDISLVYPWLSWLLAAGAIAVVVFTSRETTVQTSVDPESKSQIGPALALSIGVMASLAVLYFAFTSPTVLARWTGLDERLVIGWLGLSLGLYAAGLAFGWFTRLSRPTIWIWNGLFLIAGAVSIWTNQVSFPASGSAFPIDQPVLTFVQQAPFFVMILLCPVILLDFNQLVGELKARKHSPRALGGGFLLGSLFFLIIVLAQVFTTVYDYIPVVGPWFRDRFWLVFLLAGLGMALPMLLTQTRAVLSPGLSLQRIYLPLLGLALLASFIWSLVGQPSPTTPQHVTTLRVVTYNIQQGYSVDGRRSYPEQLAVLRSLSPDIVGLEESDVARFSGGNADVVRTISQGLGMYAYYGPRTVTGTFGIALLSRYPIENPRTFFMYSTGEQTAAIQAQIQVNGKLFTILVTHLGNDGPIIQQQQVLARLAGQSNVIAMGDFNFDTTTPQYSLTLQAWQDAWSEAGSQLASGLEPAKQIDHIFVSPGIQVHSARFVNSPASDHPALVVEINP